MSLLIVSPKNSEDAQPLSSAGEIVILSVYSKSVKNIFIFHVKKLSLFRNFKFFDSFSISRSVENTTNFQRWTKQTNKKKTREDENN